MPYRIADWGKYYENNRTRELKRMAWVPMPNKFDGDGYTQLLSHPNGTAHFGAWCALIELASRCKNGSQEPSGKYRDSAKYDASEYPHGRGILVRESGEPHDPASLERMTRIPIGVWKEALPRLVTIGWIIEYKDVGTESAQNRHAVGTIPQEGAGECPMNGTERKERKGKNTSRAVALSPDAVDALGARPIYHLFEQAFVGKNEEFNYKREGRALKELEQHALARDVPEDFAKMLLVVFWRLTHGEDKFWRSQPFLPSVLAGGGIYPRVLKEAENTKADQLTKEQAETIREVFG